MAKSSGSADQLTFEQAMQRLEAVTKDLEDGDLGLGESLERYEQGIRYLKQCHALLQQAEQKISILTELQPDGTPVSAPFDEEGLPREEKPGARGRRRSQQIPPKDSVPESDMDIQQGLF